MITPTGQLKRRVLLTILCTATVNLMPSSAIADGDKASDLYKSATTAFESGNWEVADSTYAALGQTLPANSSEGAVVNARRGYASYRLGKTREARALLEAALPNLPANTSYRTDRALEHGALAAIYESEAWASRPLAARHYGLALKDAVSASDRVTLLIGLARSAMFEPNFDPVVTTRQALALAQESGLSRDTVAYARATLGRALLNRGKPKEALEVLQIAISDLGGLDRRVNELELTARSDAALAALALGDQKTAQQYFAYAGSGLGVAGNVGWPNVNFGSIACVEGVAPDDVAVVELAIDDQGAPQQIHTVYASRPGKPGHWFEDAASTWRWSPQAVGAIGPVRRRHMRFEFRCSRNWIVDHTYIDPRELWWAARDLSPLAQDMGNDAEARLSVLRTELVQRVARHGADSPKLLPVLDALYRSELVDNLESTRLAQRALLIAQGASPPPRVLLAYREDADRQTAGPRFDYDVQPWNAYLSEKIYSGDAESRAHLHYRLSNIYEAAGRWPVAYEHLNAIVNDRQLAETSWEKLAARRDLLQHVAAGRDWAGAAKLVVAIPSVGIPCAMTPSKLLNPGVVDAPSASRHWGFTGWAFSEFDIGADGRVREPRVLVAYPPLVFTADAMADMARERLKLGGIAAGKGCVRQEQFIRYN